MIYPLRYSVRVCACISPTKRNIHAVARPWRPWVKRHEGESICAIDAMEQPCIAHIVGVAPTTQQIHRAHQVAHQLAAPLGVCALFSRTEYRPAFTGFITQEDRVKDLAFVVYDIVGSEFLQELHGRAGSPGGTSASTPSSCGL